MMSHSQDRGNYFWSASQKLASYSGKKPPRADRGGSAHPTKNQCRATQHPGGSARADLSKRPDQIGASAILVSLVVGQWETDAPTPFRPGLLYCLATSSNSRGRLGQKGRQALGNRMATPAKPTNCVFPTVGLGNASISARYHDGRGEQHPKVPGHSCRGTCMRTRWKRRTWENAQQGQGAIPSLA